MSDHDAAQAIQNAFAREMPEVMKSFSQYYMSIMPDGVLDAKQKELIAVGISVALMCRSACINSHIAQALNLGASKKEILEAMSVAMFMGGGPAVACAVEAVPFLNQQTAGTQPIDLD